MSSRECKDTRALFLDFEEGCLPAEEAAKARSHVAACPACAQVWERWQAQDRRLRTALGPAPVPRDLAGAVMAQVRGRAAQRHAPRRMPLLRWGVAAAVAAALLVLGAVLLLGKRYEPVGQVAAVQGQVLARQRGARYRSHLEAGAALYNGDELVAVAASKAALRLYDESRLAIEENTEVQLHCEAAGDDEDCSLGLPHVCLRQGEVECELASLRYFRAIGTPLGTAIARGTKFRMRYVDGEQVFLEVLEGEVLFSSPGGQLAVRPGAVWVIEGAKGVPRRLPDTAWR
ncbi:MAG: hypothetical protein FJ290_12310 [Planctomycetes bacterium]|nr:hypothetical protein [Planctomycetota bacterium]